MRMPIAIAIDTENRTQDDRKITPIMWVAFISIPPP